MKKRGDYNEKILLSLAFVASAYGFAANYHNEGELHSHVSINQVNGIKLYLKMKS